ncbi:MAG: RluA family pseudouridine synthase [Mariprofundaceae bacterium]
MSQQDKGSTCISISIDDALDGQRLDHALSVASGLSRNRIQQLIRGGAVVQQLASASGDCQKQTIRKHSLKTIAQQVFEIQLPENTPLNLTPEAIPLDILFEDEHLLIVNKPPGMVVHPSYGHDSGTLVHALLHHCPDLPGINGVERPGIVHRIDKDTSGSLIVAKTEDAHRRLVAMFAEHDIRREYIAWCRNAPFWQEQRIDAPIGRHPHQRQKMSVQAAGKSAITDACIEKRYQRDFCRLRLTLHTGRTHQIRVHLSHQQLPILGDTVYARSYRPGNNIPGLAKSAILAQQRQALHAEVLGLKHPISGQELLCRAPLADDLCALSDALDKAYA